MKLSLKTTLLILSPLLAHALGIPPNMEVVMRGGDVFHEMDEGEFPKYHNDKCTIRFSRDGNWATQNGFFTGGFDANQNSACQSGTSPMKYQLQRDGNFVSYCGYHLDYTTHTNQGQGIGDYFMGIDDACILHLYKGTLDCDGIHIEEDLWTNIRQDPLARGDRLGKGEMVRYNGTTLVMQSSDGNLVLYESLYDDALWGANQEWDAPPASNFRDHYARITKNGWLLLVGIDYQDGSETVYFRKNLHSDGATCFTVEYDADADDLVAVSCDNAVRRERQLRGSAASS